MNWKQPKVYALRHKNEAVRAASQSGGAFTAISDHVLEKSGVVYGCALDDNFKAVHIRAEDTETRDRMRGSKYIQSIQGDTFKNVKKDLTDGRLVLYTGTSCQVAGLKQYLGKEYENLVCVDLVCHGVPSPEVWADYLKWQEKRNRSRIKKAVFRNKNDFGWHSHVETLTFENGKKINSRIFTTLFYEHNTLRPCCFECPYKSVMHPGDITIADYWGIEKAAPEFDDNKGVSLVLVNNELGEKVFDSVKERIKWKATLLEDSMQQPLEGPFPAPEGRNSFWIDYKKRSFGYIAAKYGGAGTINKIKQMLGKILQIMVDLKRRLVG